MTDVNRNSGSFTPVEVNECENFSRMDSMDRFMLYIIHKGCVSLRINGVSSFFMAPCLICLSSFDSVQRLHTNHLLASSIIFPPTFLNRNMTLERIARKDYPRLAGQYDFFSLRPFLNHTEDCCYGLPLTTSALSTFTELLRRLKQELSLKQGQLWSCRSRSFLIRILTHVDDIYKDYVENGAPFDYKRNNDAIPSVLEYIHTHYSSRIRMQELCGITNTCRTTLLKNFKQATGQTVAEYIADYRMRIALKYLRFTSLTVHEIAKECGFTYDTYFVRQFAARYRVSPSEFRKEEVERRKRDFCNQ